MYHMQHLSVVFACCQLHLSFVLFVHDVCECTANRNDIIDRCISDTLTMETLERCTMNVRVARNEVQWLIVAYCFNFSSIDARHWYTMCTK